MSIRRRFALAAGTVAVALSLAGCAGAQGTPALHESDYLKLTRTNVAEAHGWTDGKLDRVGKATCGLVKDGGKADRAGWVESVKALTVAGFSGGDAGEFIVYAVSRYCPDLKSYLPAS